MYFFIALIQTNNQQLLKENIYNCEIIFILTLKKNSIHVVKHFENPLNIL